MLIGKRVILLGFILGLFVLASACATPEMKSLYTEEEIEQFDQFCTSLNADRIYFDTDKYILKADHSTVLKEWVRFLKKCPYVYLEIQGHCDERASFGYNMNLGARRAESVKDYLLKAGIEPKRISVVTMGENIPANGKHRKSSWKENRRVVVIPKILPK